MNRYTVPKDLNALIFSSIFRIIFYSNVNHKAETMNKYRCRESIITINMMSISRLLTLSQIEIDRSFEGK